MKPRKRPPGTPPRVNKEKELKFEDSLLASPVLDMGIAYYEKLGVSVAVLVGGGAVMKYANAVFPLAPAFPMIVGFMTMMISMVMMVLVSFRAWHDMKLPSNRRILNVVALSVLIVNSTFFLIAGGTAAFKQLAS
jgi:hypothetical protein